MNENSTPSSAQAASLRELATNLVRQCFDPAHPDNFALFTTDERARSSFAKFAHAFPDARFQVDWIVADASRVAVGGRISGTQLGHWRDLAPTGRRIDVACAISLLVADGTIVVLDEFSDSLAMKRQLTQDASSAGAGR